MKRNRIWQISIGVVLIAACAPTPEPGTEPLTLQTNFQQHPPASAVCTRGNDPAAITISRDGTASGRVVGRSGKFAGKVEVIGPKTVLFTVEQGAINKEVLTEEMTVINDGGTARLQGKTFECKEVMVRTAG